MRRSFLAVALLLIATAIEAENVVKLPPHRKATLKNGATILLMERKDVPLLSFTAVLRGGAVTDPAGKDGLASLTAELLQKGAGRRNAARFAEALDNVGGTMTAFAGRESITIQGDFLATDADLAIELLSDMLRRPAFDAEEFTKTRDRAVESIRAAKDADLRNLTPVYAASFVFGSHPYGKAADGSEASLSNITRDDVLAYYRNQFGGNRLILAFAGDFNAVQLEAKLRKAFDDWPKAGASLPVIDAPAPSTGRRVLLVDKPDATQTYFWIGNVGVRRADPEIARIDLANTVFGGRFTSLLNTALRIESGLSYGASSRLTRYSKPGAVAIFSYTKTETTAQAIDLALEILAKYRAGGMTPEQLASAKAFVLGQFPPELETAGQLAGRIAEIELYGLDRNDVDLYGSAISAATEDDVRKTIARLYPDPKNLTFVLIGNADAIREAAKKYGPVTEMKITDPAFAP